MGRFKQLSPYGRQFAGNRRNGRRHSCRRKISDNEIKRYRLKVLKTAVQGDFQGSLEDMERLGLKAQNVCRKWFVNPENGWAPNSPATIARKGSDRPLIDTGELRKSITYVVRKRGTGR